MRNRVMLCILCVARLFAHDRTLCYVDDCSAPQPRDYVRLLRLCSCCGSDEVMDQDEMEDLLDDLGIDADY